VAHAPVRERNVHAMPVLAADPAGQYEAELRRGLGGGDNAAPAGIPRLDLVLLGMGGDGHTASLFPRSPAVDEAERLIAVNAGPRVTPPPRVTMTFPLLTAARAVAVLVTGAGKHAALRQVERQLRFSGPDPRNLPITGVAPRGGELSWWLDAPAARAPGLIDAAGPGH